MRDSCPSVESEAGRSFQDFYVRHTRYGTTRVIGKYTER